MENSLFGSMLIYLWVLYKDSGLYKLLNKLYYFFERLFKNSLFYSLLFAPSKRRRITESKTYKVFYSPFRFLDWIRERCSFEKTRESIVLEEIRHYIDSIFSLNTNLIGAYIVTFTLLYAVLHGSLKTYVVLALIGIGVIAILINRDGMRIIEHSKVMNLLFEMFAFKIDFSFYKAQTRRRNLIYGVVLGVITALTALSISPVRAVVLVLGFTALFIIFYKVEYGLYAAIFIAPILPTKYVFALVVLTAISLIVKAIMDKKHKWILDEVGFLIMGLLIVYFVATLYSYSRMSSLGLWIVYVIFMGFYIMMVNIQKSREIIFTAVKLFIISGTIVALYGIYQYAFGGTADSGWIDQDTFENLKMRAYSTLENPNVLGAYLILSTTLTLGFVCTKIKALPKIIYLGCAGVMTLCLALTYSRGCWLGFGLSIIIFMTFYNGKLWGLFIPAVLVAPLVLPDSIIERFTSIGNMEESSTLVRVKIWMSSLRMGRDFIWTGVGMGTGAYGYVYPFYAYYYVYALHSHNTFIQILLDGGIIALLLFLALIVVFIRKMTTTYTKCKDETKDYDIQILALGIASGVIGFLVQGVFDHLFYNYRLILIFFVFIAIGMGLSHIAQNGESKAL